MSEDNLLEVDGLRVAFHTELGVSSVVNEVSMSLRGGRVLAIIGESGSGKSVLLRTVLGISRGPRTRIEGSIRFDGRELTTLADGPYQRLRGRQMAMVFQDAMTALDPVYTIGAQLTETMRRHLGLNRARARARALELLDQVRITHPDQRLDSYPHQLSGGMRQRAMSARALSCGPRLRLADEPTTALDVTVQAEILRLMLALQRESGMAMIFVTHDIGVAANIADDVAVMYGGRVVEQGTVQSVLGSPGHPYTRGLIDANITPGLRDRLRTIPGQPPSPHRLPAGCAFADRCAHVKDECRAAVPAFSRAAEPGHRVRCVLLAAPPVRESVPA